MLGLVFVFAYLAFALFSNPVVIGSPIVSNRETNRSFTSSTITASILEASFRPTLRASGFRLIQENSKRPTTVGLSNASMEIPMKQPVLKPVSRPHTSSNKRMKHTTSPPISAHIQVAPGECLWTIANTYGTTVGKLVRANHLESMTLQVGQRLTIPLKHGRVFDSGIQRAGSRGVHGVGTKSQSNWDMSGQRAQSSRHMLTYVVKSGDSLWSIAQAYGVSIDTIRSDNAIGGDAIYPGTKLRIGAVDTTYHPDAASKALIAEAPKWLIPVYKAAGRKYDVPWTVLAAIHKEETDFDVTGNDVSYAGAIGPMQFMPDTFEIFGVPAPGHRTADIRNVEDAIYSAANMLHQEGIAADPYYAIFTYNHSASYVHDILHMSAI